MYKLHLIFKYLLRRRIAWVALLAVTLCTTMVLVVISVMGGWLDMFKHSFHGLSGDIVVRNGSLVGFPYYQEMIEQINKLPNVKSAVPVIQTYALVNVMDEVVGVQVLGYPIEQIGKVNNFPGSLYLQHKRIEDQLKSLPAKAPADERDRLEKMLAAPPSFDLLDESFVYRPLPGDLKTDPSTGAVLGVPNDLAGLLRYDALRGRLVFKGVMTSGQQSALSRLSSSGDWKQGIDRLYEQSHGSGVDYCRALLRFVFGEWLDGETDGPGIINYRSLLPQARSDPSEFSGMIVGAGLADIRPDSTGKIVGRTNFMYKHLVTLTTLKVGNSHPTANDMVSHPFWVVDDSRTEVWQYDNKMVYVPFGELQKMLEMDGGAETDNATGQSISIPAYTTEIDVSAMPGADLDAIGKQVQQVVHGVWASEHRGEFVSVPEPTAQTWLQVQRTWIGAIENEKVLTVILFGIISIVAIFLIFCIFYMIAVEKTRDIGIIKSVGATSGGVAGIFLGYGAVIGIVGGLLGLLVSFLIVHNINEMHAWLGREFGIVIWNPEVYMFDKIPNTMAWNNIIVIVSVAILSSILGALIPAYFAARLNPVEALRFE